MALNLIDLWSGWLAFAAVALMLGIIIVSIVYIIGSILSNERMKSWAKLELIEIFYSAIIISLAIPAVTVTDGLLQGALGIGNHGTSPAPLSGVTTRASATTVWMYSGTGLARMLTTIDICGDPVAADPSSVYNGVYSCHIRLGMWYLDELFGETRDIAYDVYLSYIKTSMIAEFSINAEFVFEMAGFFNINPWKGFYAMGNSIKSTLFDWAVKIMMLQKFQEVFIRLIATGLYPALLVSGAILRTSTFTRKLGGLLMAIAISLYFVFPSFYAFGGLVMLNLKDQIVSSTTLNPPDIITGRINPDPPIANTIFMASTANVPQIGGGSVAASQYHQSLQQLEGMDYNDFQNALENGVAPDGSPLRLMPEVAGKLGAGGTYSNAVAAELQTNATNNIEAWIGNVTKQNKFDDFISQVWQPNGYIDVMARLTFWSMFFSLFGILATIATIRSLSSALGGDIEIAGLTRLI